MQLFIWVIIIGVIVIVAIVLFGVALLFYRDSQSCYNDYSPWCYSDWRCPNFPESDPRHFPAKLAYSKADSCSQDQTFTCTFNGNVQTLS